MGNSHRRKWGILAALDNFLGADIDEASTLSRTEPGFEASAKPGLAQVGSEGDRGPPAAGAARPIRPEEDRQADPGPRRRAHRRPHPRAPGPDPHGRGQFGVSISKTDYNKDRIPDQYVGDAPHHIAGSDQDGGTRVFDGRDGSVLKQFNLLASDSQPAPTGRRGGPGSGGPAPRPETSTGTASRTSSAARRLSTWTATRTRVACTSSCRALPRPSSPSPRVRPGAPDSVAVRGVASDLR
jgi:hypothetical protein